MRDDQKLYDEFEEFFTERGWSLERIEAAWLVYIAPDEPEETDWRLAA